MNQSLFRTGKALVIPAVATLVAVGMLCGLGAWQLQRKAEKEALIAVLDARIAATPVALPPSRDWSAMTPARDEFRRVRFTATFKPGEAQVYAGAGSALRADVSGPGVWVFGAASLPSGETIVVDRGFAANSEQSRIAPASGEAEFVGVLRFPETPGLVTPREDRSKGLWFARDHLSMAQAKNWGAVAPFYVDLEQPVPPGGVPKPGPVAVHLRNEHLNYALTWFGLAIVWLASFLVWLAQQLRHRAVP
jgi:cytochrome oxidase assembly protein ShyY1